VSSLEQVKRRQAPFDAVLILSFGGPEGPEEVRPFLENVVRGRPVPPERLEQVEAQYMAFGGVSPINAQNRALADALVKALEAAGRSLPVFLGNRNWHPFLADTLADMRQRGVERAAVFVTSAYSSYSGCRQYREDMAHAAASIGPGSPELVKLGRFHTRQGFVGPLSSGLRSVASSLPQGTPVLMSAHSIPVAMAATCDYEAQLRETAALVAVGAGVADNWRLVFQSRSGPPSQPWLEPDVSEVVRSLAGTTKDVIIVPIGFVSDHMEVLYDLDTLARRTGAEAGVEVHRTPTPGCHRDFVEMIVELIDEAEVDPPSCPSGCCPAPKHSRARA
jgi:ferrochelatase